MLFGVQMSCLREIERKAAQDATVIPSVLLLDLRLPAVSGFEILTHLQGRAAFSKMLKVVVSDLSDMESIRKAYGLGAQSFLRKPIDQLELQELIKTYPDYWVVE